MDTPDPGRAALEAEWREQRLLAFELRTPPRFAPRVDLPDSVAAWVNQAVEGKPNNLVVLGPIGTGKTHLAWQIARTYLERVAATAEIMSATDFARLARGDEAVDVFVRMQALNLLVLDDLGASALTPWVNDAIFTVIDHRYRWMRPTVITSNEADLREALGERIASRMAQEAVVVTLTGPDRRRQQ